MLNIFLCFSDEFVDVQKNSSCQEIKDWLINTVSITEQDIDRFPGIGFLDGETLCSYSIKKVIPFKTFLDVPVGLARRILLFKEKEQYKDIIGLKACFWTPEIVSQFLENNFPGQNVIKEICKIIEENIIDGFCFMSYKNEEEMKEEFPAELKKIGILFHQIIKKRNEKLTEQDCSGEKCNIKNETVSLEEDAIISFFETKTCLKQVDSEFSKQCKLQIIHSNWRNGNELEKRMLFLILCNENDYEDKKSHDGLWDKIRNNVHCWGRACTQVFQETFSESSEDTTLFCEKTKQQVSLSQRPVKMRYVMEKKIGELNSFENVFLLITNDLLDIKTHIYGFNFHKPVENKVRKKFFSFSITNSKTYWKFHPDCYSKGFSCIEYDTKSFNKPDEENNVHYSDNNMLVKSYSDVTQKINNVNESSDSKSFNKQSKIPDAQMIYKQPSTTLGDENEKAIEIQDTFTEIQLHENNDSALNTPDRESRQLKIDTNAVQEILVEQSDTQSLKTPTEIQKPRPFRESESAFLYHKHFVMETGEHDGAVGYRCFEFKYFASIELQKESNAINKFLLETLRFACGCLNSRKNGTIMFGIADSVDQRSQFRHGEVIGFNLPTEEFKQIATNSLIKAQKLCFDERTEMIVKYCIGNPVFIPVLHKNNDVSLYIMEVDVEPASYRCSNNFFLLNRSRIQGINAKKVEKEFTLFVREGSSTVSKDKVEKTLFIETILKQNITEREKYESFELSHCIKSVESPMVKLRLLLCRGNERLNKSMWPLLVLNKPTENQKQDSHFTKSLRFLRHIYFHAVFDFDDRTNENGISKLYRNAEKSAVYSDEVFRHNAGKQADLEKILGIPIAMKTIWIFANGRHDMLEPMPHLNRIEWSETYSTGIKDAITFFGNLISNGRLLVVFMLFSNDFNGVVETFYECTTRFGWKQLVVISAEEEIINNFRQLIVTEQKGTEYNIKMCSVAGEGTTWEHVCCTFLEATDNDDVSSISLPTRSGAYVDVDPFIIQNMSDLKILSAKQCESKSHSRPILQQMKIKYEEDFYKGNKVHWYNFYFENQVLKRHCLEHLIDVINELLSSTDKVGKRIAVVTIQHEPGAGGTTLAHNILWLYRKKFRCATILQITERTSQNIMTLLKYEEKDKPKPVLLLIDDLSQFDCTYEDLIWNINKEVRTTQSKEGIVCCLLVCQRETEISKNNPINPIKEINEYVVQLCQKLTKEEQQWMESKYKDIEQRDPNGHPEHLISFMILRNGFNENYITQTITQFLKLIDTKSNEFELLEYTSLISAYAQTSVRGPTVFIPVECCDQLLGKSFKKTSVWYIWEMFLSHYLKIFLVISEREETSGMEIRMSHPLLAVPVLSKILEVRGEKLSELIIRFLKSSLFTCSAYGKYILFQLSKEMLTRRLKEEYNDNKNTYFSPLIVRIEDDEEWRAAANVLENGIKIFQDCYMCQTIARLFSKKIEHDKAEEWSRYAEQFISNQMEKGSWHHNLGSILRDKFLYVLNSTNPTDSDTMISIILEAIQHFVFDREMLGKSSEIRLLYTSQDVIKTINLCAKYVTEKAIVSSSIDIKKLLTDKEYIPEELSDRWRIGFKPLFTQFIKYADKSFECIESYLCYNSIFYAHNPSKLHRFHSQLHYFFPSVRTEFARYLGEENDIEPESQRPSDLDIFHRRRLINLQGNTYMNMYDILLQVKKKDLAPAAAIEKCIKIKHHLNGLCSRQPRDKINLVAVNFLIGLLNGRNRDSWKVVLDYCKDVIGDSGGYLSQAYLFISMLLWPTERMEVEYDEGLFYSALNYLSKNKQKRHRARGIKNTDLVLKEERNITKPTAQFFLAKTGQKQKVCHRFDIFNRSKPDADEDFDKKGIWKRSQIRNTLKRLCGRIRNKDGRTCVVIRNKKSGTEIEINKIRGGNISSEEDVYFYLGFSIAGLMAYNVQAKRQDESYETEYGLDLDDKLEGYLKESAKSLQEKLNSIPNIQGKIRTGRELKQREKDVLRDESIIRQAFDIKSDDSPFD
ncbi:SAMD9 [Mytilus coruscus]|uniref:SAMD9 n=1 Tax=Mytilus coruscus TaxID=42192 RepID=A0A6J8A6J5_MYTCO|nr:SAMD9 [Mytilus coruscus]